LEVVVEDHPSMVLLLVADVLSHDLNLRFWDALAPGKVFVPPASQARFFAPSSPGSRLGLTLYRLLRRLIRLRGIKN